MERTPTKRESTRIRATWSQTKRQGQQPGVGQGAGGDAKKEVNKRAVTRMRTIRIW